MSKILFNNLSIEEAILPEYEVGKEHMITFQLHNDYDIPVEYKIESLNPEIKIIRYAEKLDGRKNGELIFSFSPDKNLRESFQSSFRIRETFR